MTAKSSPWSNPPALKPEEIHAGPEAPAEPTLEERLAALEAEHAARLASGWKPEFPEDEAALAATAAALDVDQAAFQEVLLEGAEVLTRLRALEARHAEMIAGGEQPDPEEVAELERAAAQGWRI